MAFERIAEQKIREAMAEGVFDDLPRKGQIDLDEYFQMPGDLRMAMSLLKNAGCLPEEVELLREIAAVDACLARTDHQARIGLERRRADLRLRLDLALERRKRR